MVPASGKRIRSVKIVKQDLLNSLPPRKSLRLQGPEAAATWNLANDRCAVASDETSSSSQAVRSRFTRGRGLEGGSSSPSRPPMIITADLPSWTGNYTDDSPRTSSGGANSVAWPAPRELVYETGRADFGMSVGRVPASLHSPTDAVMAVRPSSLPMDEALTEDDVESGSFLYGSSSYTSGIEENHEGGIGMEGDGRVRCHGDMDDVLVELMDLPDHALANAFFSGFLDSIEVVRSLRVVSKRTMAVASDSCKILDLHGMKMSDQDLSSLAAAFPHLTQLDLSFCKGLGGGVGASLQPCIGSLRVLSSIVRLRNFIGLEVVVDGGGMHDDVMPVRSSQKSLRGVGACDQMVEGLYNFHQLTSLDLCQSVAADNRNITDAGLEGLTGMSRLEKLGLAWNKGVTDEAIERLCRETHELREIDLALCSNITYRSLQALSSQKNLRVLSVQACRLIDDDGVHVLTAACPGLMNLDLAHLPLLTGKALHALLLLKDLRKLDVRCCEQISSYDVSTFKSARPDTWVAELRSWWP